MSAEPAPSEPRVADYESDKSRSQLGNEPSRSRGASQEKEERRRRRSPSRSRSRSRGHRDRSRERRRRRSRSRDRGRDHKNNRRHDDYHSRGRDSRRGGGGGGGPNNEEEELRKLDRTTRTLQAYNLSLRADEKDIYQLFSQAGPIVDIKIIKDRTTGRSKGFAYVEYQYRESVVPGLSLTGQPLLGQPVMVKMSEAEKNMAWEAAQAAKKQAARGLTMPVGTLPAAGGSLQPTPGRLLVTNLHPSLTEADLRPIFDNFGPVDYITIQRDANGVSVGSAILQYTVAANAASARDSLSGNLDIQGMKMMLVDAPAQYNTSVAMAAGTALASMGVVAPGGAGGVGGAVIEERLDTDADDGGGMKMTAQSRADLMSRLAATAGIQVPSMPSYGMGGPIPAYPTDQAVPMELAMERGVLGPASPIPTQCLLLKNMFDPAEETEPNWNEEIEVEVKGECSKYGPVLFVHVDADSKGHVYVKYENTQAASAAQKALHGRWFNEKQICADFQFTPLFNSHFSL